MSKPDNSPKRFIQGYKNVKKSYDYRDLLVAVDSKDQQAAEETSPEPLVKQLYEAFQSLPVSESFELDLGTCTLNLSKKAEGLFSGFAKDKDGQVVEKFDDQTLEMVAKNLQLKNLSPSYEVLAPSTPSHPDEQQDRVIAREEAADVVAVAHDRIDAIEDQLDSQSGKKLRTLKIRFGDFELELKKAINEFVVNYKKSQEVDKNSIAKAVKSWRRNISKSMHFNSDHEAAKELVENWEMHQESFNQVLFAIQQMQK